jgi:hypothetical protein
MEGWRMRRSTLIQTLSLVMFVVLVVSSPSFAALRDGYLGDVAVVTWLEGDTVKVALANESTTRKSVTISSEGWDQRWRPFFLDRTIVVPARTVLIEAFNLNSSWRGEPLSIKASTWDRTAVVEVQTQDIFRPTSYVVRSQEEVGVRVDLGFFAADRDNPYLMVDEYFRGVSAEDIGRIQVRMVEGGFKYAPDMRRIEKIEPYMMLSMFAPRPRKDATVFTFSVYKYRDDAYWNYYQDEIPGPTILVYSRNLTLQDNSHLYQSPTPAWDRI